MIPSRILPVAILLLIAQTAFAQEAAIPALQPFLANPADRQSAAALDGVYRSSQPDQQARIKQALQTEYHKLIKTDPVKAKHYRALHTSLVNIASANPRVFSYMLSAQMPTALPRDEYPMGKGQPSQIVASRIMMDLGSDILKLAMGDKQLTRQGYDPAGYDTLDKAAKHPVYRQILDMPYRVMFFWAHGGTDKLHGKPMTPEQKSALYKEFFEFTKYLLTTYNDTGKTFMIGNWEGDWMAGGKEVGHDNSLTDPKIKAYTEWLNTRTKAIDDAKAQTPHKNVNVYSYLEINHVNRARTKGIKRLVNAVLPYSQVDYVSISSYEMQGMAVWGQPKTEARLREKVFTNLKYVEDNLPPRDIPGKRVFIGEIGFNLQNVKGKNTAMADAVAQKEQARLALISAKVNLEWGTPFWLWWAVHDTAGNEFGVVNQKTGEKRTLHTELKKYYQWAEAYTTQHKTDHGVLPSPEVFRPKAIEALARQIKALEEGK